LIVTGKPSRGRASPRAMRASELAAAARQADAESLPLHNRAQGWIEALGKFPAKQRRVQIGGGNEQIRHGWFARNGLAIWRFSRK